MAHFYMLGATPVTQSNKKKRHASKDHHIP